MLRKSFTKYLFEKVLLIATIIILLFTNFSFASNATSNLGYDSRWVKVGNEWKVKNADGSYLSSCWFFDTVQSKWYRIGAINGELMTGTTGIYSSNDASSMVAGLWTERGTNKSYFFDNTSSLTYGALIDKNGYYTINGKSVYLEFEQNDANTKGSITVGLSDLRTALVKSNEVLMPKAGSGGSGGGGGSDSGGSAAPVKPVEPKVKKTILYYLIGSDLEEKDLTASYDLYDISRLDYPSDVRVLTLTGGSRMQYVEKARKASKDEKIKEMYVVNWDKNQIWEARKGIKCIEENFGTESMTDPNTLLQFLNYAKTYYPSEEYNIILSDHGGGSYGGLGTDKRPNIKKTTALSLVEIKGAFDKSGLKFGFIGFDACLMSCVEYLCGLSDYADYFMGSADIEQGSWDYTPFEALVKNPNITNENLLKGIIDKYIGKEVNKSNILALFDLKNFKKDVETHLSIFAKNIYDLSIKDYMSMKELVQTRSKTIEYGIDEDYDFVDVYDFMVKINNSNLSNNTKKAIGDLWDAVNNHLIYISSNRSTDEQGYYDVGGISMYFPLECIKSFEDSNTLTYYYDSVGNLLDADYSAMLKLVYVRMVMASNIAKSCAIADAEVTKRLNTEVLNAAKKAVGLTDDEINKIKTNIYPDLLRYRLVNDNPNFDFERSGRPGEVIFSYDKYLDDYLNEIYTIPKTYDGYGNALSLGHVIVPHIAVEETDRIVWNIAPREGYWFNIIDDKSESLVSFYPTETEIVNGDQISENYLFDKEITGYIPAILTRKDASGKKTEYYIYIYVKFAEMNNIAEILGYCYFDLVDRCEPAQVMNKFDANDIVAPIFNFEDAKDNKEVKDVGKDLKIGNAVIQRGELANESVYYDYKVIDAFNQKTDLTFGDVVFKDAPKKINFAMQEYETWYDYTYKAEDNSVNILTDVGGHQENISMVVSSVPSDNDIYYEFTQGSKKYTDDIINIFRQRDFDNIATSSITITEAPLTSPENHYLLIMDAYKEVGGVDSLYSKVYVVYPCNEGVYLFDVALWDTNRGSIYHRNKMINYITNMIKGKYDEPDPDITINIKPFANINSSNALNEINEELVLVASASELTSEIATKSDIDETEKETINETTETTTETITIETTSETVETTSETTTIETMSETTTKATVESEEPTSETVESSKKIEEPTTETTEQVESTTESEEPESDAGETTVESEEPESDAGETTVESEEQTSETIESSTKSEDSETEATETTKSTVEIKEPESDAGETTVESEEQTSETIESSTKSEEQTTETT